MSFGSNMSGYREHEMRRQRPMLIGVSLSQKTADFEIPRQNQFSGNVFPERRSKSFLQFLCFPITPHHLQECCIVLFDVLCFRMSWPQSLFPDREAMLIQGVGLLMLLLLLVEFCQLMKCIGCVKVLGSQTLFADRKSALKQQLCLLILLLLPIEDCQAVKAPCCVRVLGPQLLLPDSKSTLKQRLCLYVIPLLPVEDR